jgi:hypothetical protein
MPSHEKQRQRYFPDVFKNPFLWSNYQPFVFDAVDVTEIAQKAGIFTQVIKNIVIK